MRRTLPLTVIWSLASLPSLETQAPTTFHAEARIVQVDVAVHDAHGDMVTGLARDAFVVYENGKAQPIALFLQDDVPVSVGVVVDGSASMRERRKQVKQAALAFARASNPQDELCVVNFADRPHLDVPFTSDVSRIEDGIGRMEAIGGTALRDAVSMAAEYLSERASHDRRVLIVFTDGGDNSSQVSSDAVRARVERSGIAVYTIAVPRVDGTMPGRARHELDDLTEGTGGAAVFPRSLDELEPAAVHVARQIRQQYTLAYTPLDQRADGSYRKIRVTVKSAGKTAVRSRAGYVASSRK